MLGPSVGVCWLQTFVSLTRSSSSRQPGTQLPANSTFRSKKDGVLRYVYHFQPMLCPRLLALDQNKLWGTGTKTSQADTAIDASLDTTR
ncbi:uncharacterized protein BJ212DRAFT_1341361 [Suillus subaureus]|uniref:Uncharacterized protein n=1 Tax=Suillus subaureus TaxID=48587 RepID=A0A9P7EFP6_9AGAM|nr:uncharacterized protein BJ212DRAFT_1341361 [Suillus subaureus]KAG1819515.1 hypothetical protein BJ212DRAFT_1341361 [Suillus subaureus]